MGTTYSWQRSVRDRKDPTKIRDSVLRQSWYLVSCKKSCINVGPYRVYTGEGDKYYCSKCGDRMRVRRKAGG